MWSKLCLNQKFSQRRLNNPVCPTHYVPILVDRNELIHAFIKVSSTELNANGHVQDLNFGVQFHFLHYAINTSGACVLVTMRLLWKTKEKWVNSEY